MRKAKLVMGKSQGTIMLPNEQTFVRVARLARQMTMTKTGCKVRGSVAA